MGGPRVQAAVCGHAFSLVTLALGEREDGREGGCSEPVRWSDGAEDTSCVRRRGFMRRDVTLFVLCLRRCSVA